MKHLYLLSIALLFNLCASAQITIDMSSHPANPGMTERNVGLKPGSVYAPDLGANKAYDYTNGILSGDSLPARVYLANNDTVHFPGANRFYLFSTSFAGIPLVLNFYEANHATGHADWGFSLSRQAYDISNYTHSSGDSLIFPTQYHAYKAPHTILQFPAAYKANWSYTDRVVTDFLLDLNYFGYKNTPGMRVENILHKDSILAWGKARVPYHSAGSAGYNVLVVKSWQKVKDSMYINNSPANPVLLNTVGMTNGHDTFTYEYRFYRAYVSNPLVVMQTDSSYSKVLAVYYDPNNIDTTGIEELLSPVSLVRAYPNPSADGRFTFSFNKLLNGKSTLRLTNALGQPLQSLEVSGSGFKQLDVQLPAGSAKGVYFYTISDDTGRVLHSDRLMYSK